MSQREQQMEEWNAKDLERKALRGSLSDPADTDDGEFKHEDGCGGLIDDTSQVGADSSVPGGLFHEALGASIYLGPDDGSNQGDGGRPNPFSLQGSASGPTPSTESSSRSAVVAELSGYLRDLRAGGASSGGGRGGGGGVELPADFDEVVARMGRWDLGIGGAGVGALCGLDGFRDLPAPAAAAAAAAAGVAGSGAEQEAPPWAAYGGPGTGGAEEGGGAFAQYVGLLEDGGAPARRRKKGGGGTGAEVAGDDPAALARGMAAIKVR